MGHRCIVEAPQGLAAFRCCLLPKALLSQLSKPPAFMRCPSPLLQHAGQDVMGKWLGQDGIEAVELNERPDSG